MLLQVSIPASHFSKSVKRFYGDPDTAIIREVVQNSVDAGATEIRITVTEVGTLRVTDNGRGMTEQVVRDGLLTYSGSVKDAGAVGGFGVAKEIILFQHEFYCIRTGTIQVDGKHLQYSITRDHAPHVGTSITVMFHEDYGFNHDRFVQKAKDYLMTCEAAAAIYVNDTRIAPFKCGKLVREMPWGRVYTRRTPEAYPYAIIRANGVTMFKHWIGSSKMQVVVEITGKTVDVLSANRDGFAYTVGQSFQELIYELSVDKKTFDRTSVERQVIFLGRPKPPVLEAVAARGTNLTHDAFRELAEVLSLNMETVHSKSAPASTSKDGKKLETTVMTTGFNSDDFVIDLGPRLTLPKWLRPDAWGKRQNRLARLWKRCCQIIIAANAPVLHDMSWVIGWTLNPETEACHSKNGDGVSVLQINPLHARSYDPKTLFFELLRLAAHEIAHRAHQYHDEAFVHHVEALHTAAVVKLDSWYVEYLSATSTEL